MTPPLDTTREAYAVQIERLRRIGTSARLAIAADLSDAVLTLAVAGIRQRHPEYSDAEVARALRERLHGPGLRGRARGT